MIDNILILLKLIPCWVCGVEKNIQSDLKARFSEIPLSQMNIKGERKRAHSHSTFKMRRPHCENREKYIQRD